MNSHYHSSDQPQIRIPFFPQPITHKAVHRQPIFWIFWWHKHIRYVLEEPVISENGVYVAKYTDTRTNTVFLDRESAEAYLGKPILEPSYVDQMQVERQRDIFVEITCGHCGHVTHTKKEAVFLGPFNAVTHPISVVTSLQCSKCNKWTSAEVSTEQYIYKEPDPDCQWLVHGFSEEDQVKKKK